MKITIKKGLDLPITGKPSRKIGETPLVTRAALVGPDYIGLKPTMEVQIGDEVQKGQLLFTDKKNPGVKFTAPHPGKVVEINRGEKRAFQSVVLEIGSSYSGELSFQSFQQEQLTGLDSEAVRKNLIDSGLWTSLRTRPFGKIPEVSSSPQAIFVRAIDTEPLAADPAYTTRKNQQDFDNGIRVLSRLTSGKVHLCQGPHAYLKGPADVSTLQSTVFEGPHPAGLVGTHIHFLHPVHNNRTVWYIDYQDTIAIGRLFTTGKLLSERTISLSGPMVKEPQYYNVPIGADIAQLTNNLLHTSEHGVRTISGSVLSGNAAKGPLGFLGKYHSQVSAIEEGYERIFLGWQRPGIDKFSVKNTFAAHLFTWLKFPFTTTTHGSLRALVPVESYETVMPLDIEATFFLRSLMSQDIESGIKLGVYELEEEDISLCTFVCPGKNDFGPLLRQMLTTIEKDY